MLDDLMGALVLDAEAGPGAATLMALRRIAPPSGLAASRAIRRAAVRAGYAGTELEALPASMGGLTRRECYRIATASPDLAIGYGIGFALRHSHLATRDDLCALAGRFCHWDAVFRLERDVCPLAMLE